MASPMGTQNPGLWLNQGAVTPPTLPQTPILSAGAVLLGGGALEQTVVFTRWGILYTEGPF